MNRNIALMIVMAVVLGTNLGMVSAEESLESKARASLEHYFAAWGAADEDGRREHLTAGWAEDGIYQDPTADVHGREALIAHIGKFAGSPQAKNFSIEQSSGIDIHHKVFRFQWEMRDKTGKVITPGIDYGEFNDEGKITKIVGFFGPWPKMKD